MNIILSLINRLVDRRFDMMGKIELEEVVELLNSRINGGDFAFYRQIKIRYSPRTHFSPQSARYLQPRGQMMSRAA